MRTILGFISGLLTFSSLGIQPSFASANHSHLRSAYVRKIVNPVYYQNQCIVLMYHAVNRRKLPGDVITPQTFQNELLLLKKDHFHAISYGQFTRFLSHRGEIPPNSVLITFDNGYESFYRTAFPLLQKYHDHAVLFPIVSWLNSPHVKGDFHSLTWKQVKQMYNTGMLSVQSQTFDLHRGIQVGPSSTSPATVGIPYNALAGKTQSLVKYETAVTSDLIRSREIIMKKLHEPSVTGFAYPFGDYNSLLVHMLHKAGYRYLFTASFGWGVLSSTSHSTIYRLDVGTPYVTPTDFISTIKWIADLTNKNSTWHAPAQYVQVWHY